MSGVCADVGDVGTSLSVYEQIVSSESRMGKASTHSLYRTKFATGQMGVQYQGATSSSRRLSLADYLVANEERKYRNQ